MLYFFVIDQALSTAVKFYLRSQVEQVEKLEVKVIGKNRQILTGYIPEVWLKCDRAIYQGLHLNQAELKGTNIGFNLSDVLKRQPFKLLEPIVVNIQLRLNAQDLQASLDSSLLQSGLNDLWRMILADRQTDPISDIAWSSIAIASETLELTGAFQNKSGKLEQISFSMGLSLADSNTLNLSPIIMTDESSSATELHNQLKINLGTDVAIEQLAIESKTIICSGQITINT